MTSTTTSLHPFHTPISHAQSWGGESPLYRELDNTLHWVDPLSVPPELHILSLSPSTSSQVPAERVLKLETPVSVIRFCKEKKYEGKYICGYLKGVGILDEESGKFEITKEAIEGDERRMNDGAVDAKGRFWLGEIDLKATNFGTEGPPESYGKPKGRIWRYDPDGSLHEMDSGILLGNGIGWSPDNKTMYFNDSLAQTTYAYDFDLENGTTSNRRVFASFKDADGQPDGLVVDAQGNIWIAVYGSENYHGLSMLFQSFPMLHFFHLSNVIFDSSGSKKYQVSSSAKATTCPTFGGKDFDEVFVTTARGSDFVDGSDGGKLFRCKIPDEWGIKGMMSEAFGYEGVET